MSIHLQSIFLKWFIDLSLCLAAQRTEEELARLLLEIVLCVMWRGVEGSDDTAWLERGQVFSTLTKLGTANELLLPVDHIKLRSDYISSVLSLELLLSTSDAQKSIFHSQSAAL